MVYLTRSQSRASRHSNSSNDGNNCIPPILQPLPADDLLQLQKPNMDNIDTISLCSSAFNESFVSVVVTEADSNELLPFPAMPESDRAFHRRLFIMQEPSNTGAIYQLPHPRSGSQTLFLFDDHAEPFELIQFNKSSSNNSTYSLFYGNTLVAEPGPILLFLPIHPLFLALPQLQANANDCFKTAEEFLDDPKLSALKLLAKSDKLLVALRQAADCEEQPNGAPKFRYNAVLLLDWLKMKFAILKASLQANMAEEGHLLEQHAFGLLADYLPESIGIELKNNLAILEGKEAGEVDSTKPSGLGQSNSRKRPSTDSHSPFANGTPKAAISSAKKRISRALAAASKGTLPLRSFFSSSPANASPVVIDANVVDINIETEVKKADLDIDS